MRAKNTFNAFKYNKTIKCLLFGDNYPYIIKIILDDHSVMYAFYFIVLFSCLIVSFVPPYPFITIKIEYSLMCYQPLINIRYFFENGTYV